MRLRGYSDVPNSPVPSTENISDEIGVVGGLCHGRTVCRLHSCFYNLFTSVTGVPGMLSRSSVKMVS